MISEAARTLSPCPPLNILQCLRLSRRNTCLACCLLVRCGKAEDVSPHRDSGLHGGMHADVAPGHRFFAAIGRGSFAGAQVHALGPKTIIRQWDK